MPRRAMVTRSLWTGLLLPPYRPDRVPPPVRRWTGREWRRIRLGALPADTDGRWFAYVEKRRLHLHRAATGNGIYEARFRRQGLRWRIVELMVSSSSFEYVRWTDDYEALHLEAVIETFLLRRNVPARWLQLAAMRNGPDSGNRSRESGDP
jgi:hypothetical protein